MRLIDADALICSVCEQCDGACDICGDGERCLKCNSHCQCDLREAIDDAPTIDAKPVRHGRWIYYKNHAAVVQCTECGLIRNIYKQEGWHYCPNCGAKMDGGAEE